MPLAEKRLTRALATLSIGLLGAGCVNTVDGIPTRAPRPSSTVTPVQEILPDDNEVRAAVGNDLPAQGPPTLGGIDLLPNGIRDNGDLIPIECVAATEPAMRITYEKGPVRSVATQRYWNYDDVVVSSATAAAIELVSSTDAQRLFASFVRQWRQSEGTKVTIYKHDSSNTELYSKLTDTRGEEPILSATIIRWDNHHTEPFPDERAVGVEADLIIDVDVAITGHTQAGTRAVDIVEAMMRKASSTN